MNVRLLRFRSLAVSCVLMLAVGFTLITATQLLPQMAQSLMGYDATTSGLTLGLAGIITIVLMPVSGMVTGRVFQPKLLVFVAFAGTTYAMFYASQLTLQAGFWNLSTSRALQAMWLPFLFIPLSSASLVQVPQARTADASAILNLMRNLGGSIGVSFITNLLAWRSQFHQSRLVEHLTPYNGYGGSAGLGALMQRVTAQAQMMTYNDLFVVLAMASLAVVPLALLLPRLPKGAPAGGH
jgi:DHA2 family multidrug resistance protein